MAGKGTRTCLFLGLGCLGFITVSMLGMALIGFLVYQEAEKVQEGFENPEEQARAILRVEALPERYIADTALSIPFVMDMVILLRSEAEAEAAPDEESGLFYIKTRWFGIERSELMRFFDGEIDNLSALHKNNIYIDTREVVSRGNFMIGDTRFLYVVQRGGFQTEHGSNNGLSTLFMVECDDPDFLHFGSFFGRDIHPEAAPAELDLVGTAGDIDALQDLLEHFSFCN